MGGWGHSAGPMRCLLAVLLATVTAQGARELQSSSCSKMWSMDTCMNTGATTCAWKESATGGHCISMPKASSFIVGELPFVSTVVQNKVNVEEGVEPGTQTAKEAEEEEEEEEEEIIGLNLDGRSPLSNLDPSNLPCNCSDPGCRQ